MAAHQVRVIVREDHRLEIQLPSEFPVGPAEVTVLTEEIPQHAQTDVADAMLAVLRGLRQQRLSPEEERVLDDFEPFRAEHPLVLASLDDLAR